MKRVQAIAAREIPKLLESWLGHPVDSETEVREGGVEIDLLARSEGRSFAVEVKRSDDIPQIDAAHRHLGRLGELQPGVVPVLAVPFMGPKAREFAASVGLSWLDLSGNADIRAPGLRLLVEGQPNRFASPGRPSTAFSDKAARLSRAMLVQPERWWRQHELAEVTGVSPGYVSKVVARLVEDDLLVLAPNGGGVRPRSPELLLDAWAQVYDFRRHDIVRFHAVGRTGSGVAESLAQRLASTPDLKWAATGLTAAWRMARFADHRLVTFFVSRPLSNPEDLALRPVDRGENAWIVVPRDEAVFYGAKEVAGVRCVHPVQVYLDLLGHPERAREAADHLRSEMLGWSAP